MSKFSRAFVGIAALSATAITAHTLINVRRVRKPHPAPPPIDEPVTILLPLRNEAHRVEPTLRDLMGQKHLSNLDILILDDGSTDGTADVVRAIAGDDPRVRIIDGGDSELPAGWLGKSYACHRLSQEASGNVYVFTDAEVRFDPMAIAGAITTMRDASLQLFSPYPRQVALSWPERITQPMVTWSWLATLNVDAAEKLPFTSLAAAVGQFIVVDAQAYHASGGHSAVADKVLEDVELLRALKRNGYHGAPGLGGDVSSCRMYDGATEIYDGYTKSVWSAFGSTPQAFLVAGVMVYFYVVPPLAAVLSKDLGTRAFGLIGYTAGVVGRTETARANRERAWPDALTQPASLTAFASIIVASVIRKKRGTLTWKGRAI